MFMYISFYSTENVDIDKGAKLHILSLFQADVPDVVGTAAAVGDSATLFGYLSKHPEEVTLHHALTDHIRGQSA